MSEEEQKNFEKLHLLLSHFGGRINDGAFSILSISRGGRPIAKIAYEMEQKSCALRPVISIIMSVHSIRAFWLSMIGLLENVQSNSV